MRWTVPRLACGGEPKVSAWGRTSNSALRLAYTRNRQHRYFRLALSTLERRLLSGGHAIRAIPFLVRLSLQHGRD